MIHEQYGSPQSKAVSIEHVLLGVFSCKRGGVGGLADADSIRQEPIAHMLFGLLALYHVAPAIEKGRIDTFYADSSNAIGYSIDDFFSEEEEIRVYNGVESAADFFEELREQFMSIVQDITQKTAKSVSGY